MIVRQIRLPWPLVALWPNQKRHWRNVYAAREIQKAEAQAICLEAGLHMHTRPPSDYLLTYVFCPPSRRRYDLDGALAAMKGATDMIAAALRVDDSRFDFDLRRGEPCRDGCVIVDIEVMQ